MDIRVVMRLENERSCIHGSHLYNKQEIKTENIGVGTHGISIGCCRFVADPKPNTDIGSHKYYTRLVNMYQTCMMYIHFRGPTTDIGSYAYYTRFVKMYKTCTMIVHVWVGSYTFGQNYTIIVHFSYILTKTIQ